MQLCLISYLIAARIVNISSLIYVSGSEHVALLVHIQYIEDHTTTFSLVPDRVTGEMNVFLFLSLCPNRDVKSSAQVLLSVRAVFNLTSKGIGRDSGQTSKPPPP